MIEKLLHLELLEVIANQMKFLTDQTMADIEDHDYIKAIEKIIQMRTLIEVLESTIRSLGMQQQVDPSEIENYDILWTAI